MRERGETFRFCANCLGPEIVAGIQYSGAQAEAHAPAKWRDKILRAQPTVGEDVLVGLGCRRALREASRVLCIASLQRFKR